MVILSTSRLCQIASEYNLFVVEDAAHALPSLSAGHLVGTLNSDATVFSFYANKTITTGEGGMLVTRNEQLASRARTMRLHGISKDVFSRFTSNTPSWYYEVIAPGFKYNLTDVAASIGIHQLRKASDFHKRRTLAAKQYDSLLDPSLVCLPPALRICVIILGIYT